MMDITDKDPYRGKMRPPTSFDGATHRLEKVTSECTECGDCLGVCPILEDLGLTPGQLARQVLEDGVSQESLHTIQRCSLCGLCTSDCPVPVEWPSR
jgi:heterodisulfide reductase subunit C